jgi:hypothetical protein
VFFFFFGYGKPSTYWCLLSGKIKTFYVPSVVTEKRLPSRPVPVVIIIVIIRRDALLCALTWRQKMQKYSFSFVCIKRAILIIIYDILSMKAKFWCYDHKFWVKSMHIIGHPLNDNNNNNDWNGPGWKTFFRDYRRHNIKSLDFRSLHKRRQMKWCWSIRIN